MGHSSSPGHNLRKETFHFHRHLRSCWGIIKRSTSIGIFAVAGGLFDQIEFRVI